MSLPLRESKTDQKGRESVVVLGSRSDFELCPIWALSMYLAVRSFGEGLLFCTPTGSLE